MRRLANGRWGGCHRGSPGRRRGRRGFAFLRTSPSSERRFQSKPSRRLAVSLDQASLPNGRSRATDSRSRRRAAAESGLFTRLSQAPSRGEGSPRQCSGSALSQPGRLDHFQCSARTTSSARRGFRSKWPDPWCLSRWSRGRTIRRMPPSRTWLPSSSFFRRAIGIRNRLTLTDILNSKMIISKLQFMFGLWDHGPMPERFADNLETWKRSLPQLSVKVWNRFECYELLKKYEGLSWVLRLRPVQQSDVVRLLIIYDGGGWYNDLDTRPVPDAASTWESCSDKDLVVITEGTCDATATQMTCRYRYREGVPEDSVRIANFSFAATARNEFLWRCIRLAERRCKQFPSGSDDYYPIFTTGPDVITTTYHAAKVDSSFLLPVGRWCADAESGTWRNGRA